MDNSMSGKLKTFIFVLVMLMISVLTGGCITNKSDEWRSQGLKYCETTKNPEPFNFTTGQWIIPQQTTPTSSNETSPGGTAQSNPDGTAQKSSSTSSSDTKTTPSTPKTS